MTEFQELTQDAPNFVSMERGELVAYAYGMFAAGTKANAENAKLREELDDQASYDQILSDILCQQTELCIKAETDNAKLREMVRDLHTAYVETLNECESLNEKLIWECSGSIDDDIAKSRAKFKANRHRFDDALRELGIGENE